MKDKELFIKEDCLSEDLGKELIILDIKSGCYHSLNKTASVIWREIQEKNPTLEVLKESLMRKYDSPEIFSDCNFFVEELLEKKLIEFK